MLFIILTISDSGDNEYILNLGDCQRAPQATFTLTRSTHWEYARTRRKTYTYDALSPLQSTAESYAVILNAFAVASQSIL